MRFRNVIISSFWGENESIDTQVTYCFTEITFYEQNKQIPWGFLSSGEWRDLLSEQVESYLSRFVCLYKCTVSSVVYNDSLCISPLSAVQYLNLNSCSAISQLCSCFLIYCNNYQIMVVSRLTSLPTRTRERSCFIRERCHFLRLSVSTFETSNLIHC